jgi:hypothetical protein
MDKIKEKQGGSAAFEWIILFPLMFVMMLVIFCLWWTCSYAIAINDLADEIAQDLNINGLAAHNASYQDSANNGGSIYTDGKYDNININLLNYRNYAKKFIMITGDDIYNSNIPNKIATFAQTSTSGYNTDKNLYLYPTINKATIRISFDNSTDSSNIFYTGKYYNRSTKTYKSIAKLKPGSKITVILDYSLWGINMSATGFALTT